MRVLPTRRELVRGSTIAAGLLTLAHAVAAIVVTQPGVGVERCLWLEGASDPGARADPGRLRAHVHVLARDLVPRDFRHPENLDRAAAYLARELRGLGDAVRVRQEVYEIDGTPYANVIATLGPTEGPRVVVGAHYDAWGSGPGADDNASGTAGLLELARLLAARPRGALRRPVELVAYSTEEPPCFATPRMGSAVHVRRQAEAGVQVLAMIGLEMIGYTAEHQPVPTIWMRPLYPRRGDFVLVAGRLEDRALVRSVKRCLEAVEGLPVASYSGPTAVGIDLSDHRNYWAQGVPAVMVGDTAFVRNPHYHQATDLPETLDYAFMAKIVDGVAHAVETLTL